LNEYNPNHWNDPLEEEKFDSRITTSQLYMSLLVFAKTYYLYKNDESCIKMAKAIDESLDDFSEMLLETVETLVPSKMLLAYALRLKLHDNWR